MRIKVGSDISGTFGPEMPTRLVTQLVFQQNGRRVGHTGNKIQNRCGRLHYKHSVAAHRFGL
jgi:hypothetical protein